MKKGFTLIELLAVIVILAIIAVIAVPIILNIIEDTKENAILRSVEMYNKAVENSIATTMLSGNKFENGSYELNENGNLQLGSIEIKLDISGEKPTFARFDIIDGKIIYYEVELEGKMYTTPSTPVECFEFTPNIETYRIFSVTDYEACLNSNPQFEEYYDVEEIEEICSGNYNGDIESFIGFCLAGPGCSEHIKIETITNVINKYDAITNYTCEDKNVVIPYGVSKISRYAFDRNRLTTVSLPSSLLSIEESAFTGNELEYIIVPNSVKEIDKFAFSGLPIKKLYLGSGINYFEVQIVNWEKPTFYYLETVFLSSSDTEIKLLTPDCYSCGYGGLEDCLQKKVDIIRR